MANNFNHVRAVLAETNPVVRAGLQSGLFRHGIRDVLVCRDVDQLRQALTQEIIDLVICDVSLPPIPFAAVGQEIRQYRMGRNPFALMIATLSEASSEEVRAGINGGADSMVRKPMPISAITDRLAPLLRVRRPFVATEDYVGPNRRNNHRESEMDGSVIDTPITMREKAFGRHAPDHLQVLIDHAWAQIEQVRQRQTAETLLRIIDRVLAFYDGFGTIEGQKFDLNRLTSLCSRSDQPRLGVRSPEQGSTGLADVVKRIAASPLAPHQSQLEQLARLRRSVGMDAAAKHHPGGRGLPN
jgi:DNA-binding response OmpR family regulator